MKLVLIEVIENLEDHNILVVDCSAIEELKRYEVDNVLGKKVFLLTYV